MVKPREKTHTNLKQNIKTKGDKIMKECVVIDGVRSANARAHKDKGWFRNVRPEQVLIEVL